MAQDLSCHLASPLGSFMCVLWGGTQTAVPQGLVDILLPALLLPLWLTAPERSFCPGGLTLSLAPEVGTGPWFPNGQVTPTQQMEFQDLGWAAGKGEPLSIGQCCRHREASERGGHVRGEAVRGSRKGGRGGWTVEAIREERDGLLLAAFEAWIPRSPDSFLLLKPVGVRTLALH